MKAFGAVGDGSTDDTAAVQKAIDSGKAVIYFPQASYRLNGTVVVRGNVRRVIGFSSSFTGAEGKTLFRFEGTRHPVAFERFNFFGGGKLEHANERPVTLRHSTGPAKQGIVTTGKNRHWFFEDVCTSHFTLPPGTRLHARQFNCEPEPPGAGFANDGALVWVLGLPIPGGCRRSRLLVRREWGGASADVDPPDPRAFGGGSTARTAGRTARGGNLHR
ncbi:glycosyl hydrolase family 28-related protein [Luteolibacter arcticus]|uniref:glycosyl hydrolase family 28-related protein n=1 Tax=Luteolibacter arcticus TaxID=1581411 RepID=UPI0029CAAD6E|nr:glycosyl hydrolase family 28-related protein [Luteolibacter arcticus]